MAVPWLRWLVAGASHRQGTDWQPGSVHVGFVLDEVALRRILLRVFRFSLATVAPYSCITWGNAQFLIIKAGGTFSYHCALKCLNNEKSACIKLHIFGKGGVK
jgi:hypothetical protein